MKKYQLLHGDCREVLKTLPDNSVDSIVTDPPYELGFMGKSWDSTGVAYDSNLWREAYRVLKHGGHILSFGGSRTYHRMACAIEDAGFEVRDQIMWVYGSGFPKSLNISKSVEAKITTGSCAKNNFNKLSGERRDGKIGMYNTVEEQGFRKKNPKQLGAFDLTPTTAAAKQWCGWGTALKPAHEPIVLARKPLEGTVADNILKWGVGGLNIDGCRVEYQSDQDKEKAHYNALGMERLKIEEGEKLGSFEGGWKKHKPTLPTGRFPANFMHDGSQQLLDLFPCDADNSAARFFYCPKASKADRNDGCEGLPDKEWSTEGACVPERDSRPFNPSKNNHPTVKPTELMRYLVRLITPKGGLVLDPFNGSGSTGKASMLEGMRYIGIEMNSEYIKIAEARLKWATENNEQ